MTVRFSFLWLLVFALVSAFGVYGVKYKVQALKAQTMQAERSLRDEKRNLHVLAAEWTFLTRPERLQRLSEKYLALQAATPRQLADLETLKLQGAREIAETAKPDAASASKMVSATASGQAAPMVVASSEADDNER